MLKFENSPYSYDDVKMWADTYRETLSFQETARKHNVCGDVITLWLKYFKTDLSLEFKLEIETREKLNGVKTCSVCKKTLPLSSFRKSTRMWNKRSKSLGKRQI